MVFHRSLAIICLSINVFLFKTNHIHIATMVLSDVSLTHHYGLPSIKTINICQIHHLLLMISTDARSTIFVMISNLTRSTIVRDLTVWRLTVATLTFAVFMLYFSCHYLSPPRLLSSILWWFESCFALCFSFIGCLCYLRVNSSPPNRLDNLSFIM